MDSYCTSRILYEPYEWILSQFYSIVLPVMAPINNNNIYVCCIKMREFVISRKCIVYIINYSHKNRI